MSALYLVRQARHVVSCPPDEITWLDRGLLSGNQDLTLHRSPRCAGLRYVHHRWELFSRDRTYQVYLAPHEPRCPWITRRCGGGPARPAGGPRAALRDAAGGPGGRGLAGQRRHLGAAAADRGPGAAPGGPPRLAGEQPPTQERRCCRRPQARPGSRPPAGSGGARPRLLRPQRRRPDGDGLPLPGVHPRPARPAAGADDGGRHRLRPERRRRGLGLQEAAAGLHLGRARPPASNWPSSCSPTGC